MRTRSTFLANLELKDFEDTIPLLTDELGFDVINKPFIMVWDILNSLSHHMHPYLKDLSISELLQTWRYVNALMMPLDIEFMINLRNYTSARLVNEGKRLHLMGSYDRYFEIKVLIGSIHPEMTLETLENVALTYRDILRQTPLTFQDRHLYIIEAAIQSERRHTFSYGPCPVLAGTCIYPITGIMIGSCATNSKCCIPVMYQFINAQSRKVIHELSADEVKVHHVPTSKRRSGQTLISVPKLNLTIEQYCNWPLYLYKSSSNPIIYIIVLWAKDPKKIDN